MPATYQMHRERPSLIYCSRVFGAALLMLAPSGAVADENNWMSSFLQTAGGCSALENVSSVLDAPRAGFIFGKRLQDWTYKDVSELLPLLETCQRRLESQPEVTLETTRSIRKNSKIIMDELPARLLEAKRSNNGDEVASEKMTAEGIDEALSGVVKMHRDSEAEKAYQEQSARGRAEASRQAEAVREAHQLQAAAREQHVEDERRAAAAHEARAARLQAQEAQRRANPPPSTSSSNYASSLQNEPMNTSLSAWIMEVRAQIVGRLAEVSQQRTFQGSFQISFHVDGLGNSSNFEIIKYSGGATLRSIIIGSVALLRLSPPPDREDHVIMLNIRLK